LSIPGKVGCADIDDATLVDVPWGDVTGGDEVAEPLRGIGVDLVVIG
jgi:hypothetical protein